MNIMKNKKTYSGQALAIIMVVLVISSIIGFSIFTRSLRDKRSTVQERYSAEALEVNDNILDYILQNINEGEISGLVIDREYASDGVYNIRNLLNMGNNLFNKLTVCSLDEPNNKYTVKLFYGDNDTVYQVEPGQAFSFVVPEGQEIKEDTCIINVKFQPEDIPANTGFTINKIYRTSPTGATIKDYDYSDAETYCLSTNCTNFEKNPKNPNDVRWDPATTLEILAGGVNLDRAQLIAINSRIRFTYEPTAACGDLFKTLILRSSATCNGVFRSKEAIIPVHRAHFSIFNYVLFNGSGEMNSNQ